MGFRSKLRKCYFMKTSLFIFHRGSIYLIVTDCFFISVRIQLIGLGLVNTFKNSFIGEINYKIYNMSYIFKTIWILISIILHVCTEEV